MNVQDTQEHKAINHWWNKAKYLEEELKWALLHLDFTRMNEEDSERSRKLINHYKVKHPEMGPNWDHS